MYGPLDVPTVMWFSVHLLGLHCVKGFAVIIYKISLRVSCTSGGVMRAAGG